MESESYDPGDQRSFRRCEQCGQPTPSQQPACVNCGVVSVQAIVAEQQAKEEQRFLRALFSRSTPVTYSILIINLAIYILMAIVTGGNLLEALVYMNDRRVLIAFGAKTNELLQSGEWFRLVTPIFIHGGLLHMASNSYAIWNIGPLVEKLYGSSRFLLIYLLAGIGGVAGSYLGSLTRSPSTPSVGASGAIFGLCGLLFAFSYRYRDESPKNFRRSLSSGILPVIVINLFIGFTIPVIDNAAHIGGLITGALLTFVIPYVAPGRARRSNLGLAILAICVMVTIYSFVLAYQASRSEVGQRSYAARNFLRSFVAGDDAMVDVLKSTLKSESGRPSSESIVRLEDAARALERTTAPDEQAEGLRREMLDLIRRQQRIIELSPSSSQSRDLDIMADEFLRLRQRFREWEEKR